VIAQRLERSIKYSRFAITAHSDGPHAISDCLPKPALNHFSRTNFNVERLGGNYRF
jgi:hypothetical protein